MPGVINKDAYIEKIRAAEATLNYKSLVVRPFIDRQPCLQFDIENIGNLDIELLMLEFHLPRRVIEPHWTGGGSGLDTEQREDEFWIGCYGPRGAVHPRYADSPSRYHVYDGEISTKV